MLRHLLFWIVFIFSGFQVSTPQFVVLQHEPIKKQTKAPLLVLLHGYGSNEEDLFDLAKTFDPRLKSFSLRAPQPLPGGGFAWFHLNREPVKGLTYDYKEARESGINVMKWILNTCREQNLDSNRIYLMGFSQGAMLSFDIALAYPGRIKGVIALSGKLMPESRRAIKSTSVLKNLSVFVGHGSQDLLIPPAEAQEARNYLNSLGVTDLQMKMYTIPHSLSGDEITDIRKWLLTHLDQSEPPKPKK